MPKTSSSAARYTQRPRPALLLALRYLDEIMILHYCRDLPQPFLRGCESTQPNRGRTCCGTLSNNQRRLRLREGKRRVVRQLVNIRPNSRSVEPRHRRDRTLSRRFIRRRCRSCRSLPRRLRRSLRRSSGYWCRRPLILWENSPAPMQRPICSLQFQNSTFPTHQQ